MKPEIKTLEAGLYLVATPIGNARDITLRALDILASADIIAAEDTRTAQKLMAIHGVNVGKRPLIAYHDHSGNAGRQGILKLLQQGRSVAYISEAGTPLVADPGFALARDAGRNGHLVTTAPGASAALAALSLSGLPSDRFLFAGFPPTGKAARVKWLTELTALPTTLILYESPKRIEKLLTTLCDITDPDRKGAICREITKKFEEVIRASLAELSDIAASRSFKGEIVLVLEQGKAQTSDETMEAALAKMLKTMSLKDAVANVSQAYGLARRKVYQAALEMEINQESDV